MLRLRIGLVVSLWFTLLPSFAHADPLDVLNSNYLKNGQLVGDFHSGTDFIDTSATATIWSGANGTGNVVATISPAANDASCWNVPYYCWLDAGVRSSDTANSVTFSGPANTIGLTDSTLGNGRTAIPEPSSIYLLAIGIAACCAQGLRRFLRKLK